MLHMIFEIYNYYFTNLRINIQFRNTYCCSYRIQHSLDKYTDANSHIEDRMAIQKICNAVQIHRKAVQSVSNGVKNSSILQNN